MWSASFEGNAGQAVNTSEWNIITNVNFNNEVQEYTTSTDNLRLSGEGTLQIIPRRSPSGEWTSGRIESKFSYTPSDKEVTVFQAELRFGDSPRSQQQGIWPAFWTLGESHRHGVPWPECGELDIMERKNGEPETFGVPHCGPGDVPCGLMVKTVPMPPADGDFHVWKIEIDRRPADWQSESITWIRDDVEYNKVTGADIDDEEIWKAIAQSPMYFILNVAVGGNFPGPPNDETADGESNMLEVRKVEVFG
ncbi:hypothetical protein VTK26DRAFT_673 [Humicola hyalothermophila]